MGYVTKNQRLRAKVEAASAKREIDRLREEEAELTRRRSTVERTLLHALLVSEGIGPCTVCGRSVPSPCDSAEGFRMDGPWDNFCTAVFTR